MRNLFVMKPWKKLWSLTILAPAAGHHASDGHDHAKDDHSKLNSFRDLKDNLENKYFLLKLQLPLKIWTRQSKILTILGHADGHHAGDGHDHSKDDHSKLK